jgi:hypothetical protein
MNSGQQMPCNTLRQSHHSNIPDTPAFYCNATNNSHRQSQNVYPTHEHPFVGGHVHARGPKPHLTHTIKPDTYDGSQSYEQYASHFQDCAELSGWDSRTKVLILASCLRGQARTYYMSLSDNERRDYFLLSNRLKQRFGSSRHQSLWLSKLENRRRNKGESVASLGDDLRQLAQKAYYDLDHRAQERLALNQLYKLIPLDMKCRCIDHNCESVTEAISVIEKYESILGSPHVPNVRLLDTKNDYSSQSFSDIFTTMKSIENRLSKIEMSTPKQPVNENTSNGRVCFGCKSPEHLWRQCPYNQNRQNFNSRRNNTPPKYSPNVHPSHSYSNATNSNQQNRNYSSAISQPQHVSEN